MAKYNKTKKNNRNKPLWSAKERSVFIIIGACFFLLVIGWFGFATKEDRAKQNAYKAFVGTVVPDSMVCMVSGEIKHKKINPVEIEGKTYWGCCGQCKTKLTYNTNNARIAKDPFSGSLVGKADAYIRINPNNNRQAMFFESEETYHKYINSIKTDKL